MGQRFLSIAVIGIFITTLIEVRRNRHTKELDQTIEIVKDAGRKLEAVMSVDYTYQDVADAMREFEKAEDLIYKLLLAITKRIPPN